MSFTWVERVSRAHVPTCRVTANQSDHQVFDVTQGYATAWGWGIGWHAYTPRLRPLALPKYIAYYTNLLAQQS